MEPIGLCQPAGAVELPAQCLVRAEQKRAEATLQAEDERNGALPGAVQVVCARVLYELFGCTELRADTAQPSLFALLDARLRACRPERGDLRALAPCPEVDAALGRLVSIIQGDYAAHTDVPWQAQDYAPEDTVRVALLAQIQSDPRLLERAHRLRSCAGLAETAMEQHYSRTLLAQLRAQAKPFLPQPAGALRTALLERCLAKFPYTRNYRLLTASELRLLQHPAPPLLIRTAHQQVLSPSQRQRLEAELSQLRQQSSQRSALCHSQTIAVCGAGPLPVTGLMMHTFTGARVSLIERDPSAVEMSRALITQLERLQVLDAGRVTVVQADVADFTPRADIVLVASLVDNPAKLRLVSRLREAASGLQALLLRSASQLCAELAYEPVETLEFSDPSLPFCGESAPATDVEGRAERLVCSAREVLNDTELYRPVQLRGAQPSWLRDLVVQLRAADQRPRLTIDERKSHER